MLVWRWGIMRLRHKNTHWGIISILVVIEAMGKEMEELWAKDRKGSLG